MSNVELTPTQLADLLASGQYKKGRGQLYSRERNSYCCLGVYAKAAGILAGNTCHGSASILPSSAKPSWMSHGLMVQLITINDSSGGFDKVIALLRSL